MTSAVKEGKARKHAGKKEKRGTQNMVLHTICEWKVEPSERN